ncbi:MAG: DUF4258 domain-containing protein [Candidatus Aenigmarchaeota archaeon]|nr:DUF4258 domain-containing protein [Candidatus Aenigmarchaeota archaeon]
MPKNIRCTYHAIKRKLERDISDEEINQTLASPDYTISSIEERKIAVKQAGSRTLRVVYKEEKENIIIITVY